MAQWYRNIQDIITLIDACIRAQQDEALTLRALAQKLGYSEYYTSRKFRELAGMTLRDYLRCGGWRLPCATCATLTRAFWTSL